MVIRTEREYKEYVERMQKQFGISPTHKTLKEKRTATRLANKLAREMGYAGGINQYIREEQELIHTIIKEKIKEKKNRGALKNEFI